MRRQFLWWPVACALLAGVSARADSLHLINGDRYVGNILLVNEQEVQLQSEIVGLLKIPRAKVLTITFGNTPTAPPAPPAPAAAAAVAPTNTLPAFDPKAVEKVQQEFLGTATPEANDMFSQILGDLGSGRMSLDDLRKQAKDSLEQLRDLQADLGEEGDNPLISSYVSILERFIKQGPAGAKAVKPPAVVTPPAKDDPDE